MRAVDSECVDAPKVRSLTSPLILSLPNFVLLLVAAIFGHGIFQGLGWQSLSILVLSVTAFAGWCISRMFSEGVWSVPFLLYLVIALFHVGLYIGPASTATTTVQANGIWTSWINESNMRTVGMPLLLAFLSFAAFTGIGSWLSSTKLLSHSPTEVGSSAHAYETERHAVADVGSTLVVLGVAVWFVFSVVAAGPMFLAGTYEQFLATTRTFPMGFLYLVIAVGAVFLAQDPFRPLGKIALCAFGVFLIAGFVIGLRGETLMPLVAALAVYAKRNSMPSPRTFVVASLLILLAIATVAQVRTVGLAGLSGKHVSVGPLEGIEEMGYSVRPLVASVDWHVNAREDFELGATYWAPFERGLASLISAPMVPADEDYRLMNVEIAQRIGQIGGSIVAEAHHNFGNVGVAAVMGLTGLAGGLISRGKVTPIRVALLGIFAVMVLMHVRNSFAPLPLWGTFGLILLTIAIGWAKVRRSVERRT